jgi:sialate O-acetylesterase
MSRYVLPIYCLSFTLLSSVCLFAQSKPKPWHGKQCAVALTYDDALNVHIDKVLPALDSLGLKGTFYVTVMGNAGASRIADWRKAAQTGHELGNHTLYHPCDATYAGMQWVRPEYDMSRYTKRRMVDELRATNAFLEAIDGRKKRTFAFTCGHKKVAEGEFIQSLTNDFVAARAVREEMHPIDQVKLMDVDCYSMEGDKAADMIKLVEQARQTGALLVFLFHGVGGEHTLNVEESEHRALLKYLKSLEKEIWIAPLVEIAEHVKAYQRK